MLSRVHIENFRCIREADLALDSRATGVVGPNGSGKTSLLEAIYFLSQARSFRTAKRDRLVGPAAAELRSVGYLRADGRTRVAGIEFGSELTARLDGESVKSVSEIAELLPVQVIDPGLHRVVEEGSARRRKLLDWGVFHVEPTFLAPWRRYQRALLQRNAALKTGGALIAWEREMIAAAAVIDHARRSYCEALHPIFEVIVGQLLPMPIEVHYRAGWSADLSFESALQECRARDAKLRVTTAGPHRADLDFRSDGVPARDVVSRGQQKLLAAALILAQTRLHAAQSRSGAVLLLDDPAAELDVDNLGKLLSVVRDTPCQLVATSVSTAGLAGVETGAVFHVEQGKFTRML